MDFLYHGQSPEDHRRMKFKNLSQNFIVHLIFWTVIQARWSRTLPSSLVYKGKKVQQTERDNFEKKFPILSSKFKKNSLKVVEKYCRFLLGAFKECMAKYHSEFRPSFKTWKKVKESIKTTTISPMMSISTTPVQLMTAHEKIYVRI